MVIAESVTAGNRRWLYLRQAEHDHDPFILLRHASCVMVRLPFSHRLMHQYRGLSEIVALVLDEHV